MKLLTALPLCLLALTVGCGTEDGTETAGNETDATPVFYTADKTVEVKVPDMKCPVDCYPRVKEALESQPGVKDVTLVKQEEEGKINDPRVVVTLDEKFDATAAEAAIAEAGFKNAETKEATAETLAQTTTPETKTETDTEQADTKEKTETPVAN